MIDDKAPKGPMDFTSSDFEEVFKAMEDKTPGMIAVPCTDKQLKEIVRLKLNEFEAFHFLLDVNIKNDKPI